MFLPLQNEETLQTCAPLTKRGLLGGDAGDTGEVGDSGAVDADERELDEDMWGLERVYRRQTP